MSHIRKTSIEAFKTIKENGLLSARRLEVYSYIFEHGPCTIRGTYEGLMQPGVYINSISPRFIELVRLGILDEVGTRKETTTGHTVILYDVNERIPRKTEKRGKVHNLIVQINNLELKIKEKKRKLNTLTAPKFKPGEDNLSFKL